jgi:Na+/melibiose symporter-like transporter
LWIPLRWIFNEQGQIWALIILAFLMAIPLTPLGVGFNALFAESVPDRFRAHVAGTRNVTFAIAYMLTSFGAGFILKSLPLETGYQVIFALGAFGAAMSSYHLYHIRPMQEEIFPLQSAPQPDASPAIDPPRGFKSALRLDIWGTPFRNVLIALFFFHLTHYLPTPLYPLFNVRVLNLNDNNIGTGTALYYLTVLIGSTQFRRIAHRYGKKKVTGFGAAGMASSMEAKVASADVYNSPGWRRMQDRAGNRPVVQPREAKEMVIDATAVSSFAMGDRAFHDKFGYGTVVGIEGEKLDIAFDKAGIKKIVARFVRSAAAADDVPF